MVGPVWIDSNTCAFISRMRLKTNALNKKTHYSAHLVWTTRYLCHTFNFYLTQIATDKIDKSVVYFGTFSTCMDTSNADRQIQQLHISKCWRLIDDRRKALNLIFYSRYGCDSEISHDTRNKITQNTAAIFAWLMGFQLILFELIYRNKNMRCKSRQMRIPAKILHILNFRIL